MKEGRKELKIGSLEGKKETTYSEANHRVTAPEASPTHISEPSLREGWLLIKLLLFAPSSGQDTSHHIQTERKKQIKERLKAVKCYQTPGTFITTLFSRQFSQKMTQNTPGHELSEHLLLTECRRSTGHRR